MTEHRRAASDSVQRIMNKAEAMGLSPARVAQALSDKPAEDAAAGGLKRRRRFLRRRAKAPRAV